MGDTADWISAVCSLIAAVVGVVTLVTVIQAADELIARQRKFREYMSADSLRVWNDVVKSRTIYSYFHPQVVAPQIKIANLVSNDWKPEVNTFNFEIYAVSLMLGREFQKRNVNAEFLSYPNTQEYKLTSRFMSALLMFPSWKNAYQIRSMATEIAGAAFDDSIAATKAQTVKYSYSRDNY